MSIDEEPRSPVFIGPEEKSEVTSKWTISDIGTFLNLQREREKLLFHEISTLKTQVTALYKSVVVGNGQPSLTYSVRRHDEWIASINRFLWMVLTAIVTQIIISMCSMLGAMFFLISEIMK